MFSPPRLLIPAAEARSHGDLPSGSVWSKKPRAAMSSLNASASLVSEEFAASGLHPTFDRSWLTSLSTSTSAALRADTDAGAALAAGALLAVRDGLLAGRDAVARGAGIPPAVLDGVAEGEADVEAEADAEADGLGDAGRVAVLPTPASPSRWSAPPDVPPCSVAVLPGEPAACTESLPVSVLPPSL
jgi:hypothetical protein